MKKMTRSIKGAMSFLRRPSVLQYRETKPQVFKNQIVRGPIVRNEEVIAYAAKAAHVPETTVSLAMSAMFDAINYYVTQGRTVQVPHLGSFKADTKVKVAQTEAECTTEKIKRRRIRFYPKGDIAELARWDNITFKDEKTLSKMAGFVYPS